MRRKGPLTLETYRCFFVDPWGTPVSINNLNHILNMHGFAKLYREPKREIMRYLVGQVDLLPPRRSTLHGAALSAAARPSTAVITTAQAKADIEAIGWAECPIGCVAAFAAQAADAPEPVDRVPLPADFVVVGRRPRSKRTRTSAYKHTRKRKRDDAPQNVTVMVTVKEEKEEPSPPPLPPPRWMRSPTPPPPPPSPPQPSSAQQLLPPRDVAPPPPTPRGAHQPTLAPLPARPCWGSPCVQPSHQPQLYWGLPLPMSGPGTPGLTPGWALPTVPSCYPAPFWGAPSVMPPLTPRVPLDWPPTQPPHGPGMLSPTACPPMHLQQEPFPAHWPGQQPHPAQLQTPPPPLQLRPPPPHLQGLLPLPGHQPPAQLQSPPPPSQLHHPPPHLQGQMSLPPPHLQGPPPPPLHLHGPPPGFF